MLHGSVFDGKAALDVALAVLAVPLFGLDGAVPAMLRSEFDDWDLVFCEPDVEVEDAVSLLISLVAFRVEVVVTVLWPVIVKYVY